MLRGTALNPPHLEYTTGGEGSSPPPPLLPHPSSPAAPHLSIKSWPGFQEGGWGAACIHGLTMIKTHSKEPFKGPAPTMESLIGAHSARIVFFRQGKKSFGEATITLSAALCM